MVTWKVICDDVDRWAAEFQGEPFAAILCDPPYHLTGGFMSKDWDRDGPDAISFQKETWQALAEHLLPGGFIMAFGGSRTFHRLACAIEDAGLVLNSTVFLWAQGSGFPKSANIHAQLEKRLCYKKGDNWYYKNDDELMRAKPPFRHPDADRFYGHRYGTQCLKPSVEPIIVAQKPWEGKRLDCIVETGAGALNIEAARIGTGGQGGGAKMSSSGNTLGNFGHYEGDGFKTSPQGRWPANFMLCHAEGCERVGVKRVKGTANTPRNRDRISNPYHLTADNFDNNTPDAPNGYADLNGMETVDAWSCQLNPGDVDWCDCEK